MLFDPNQDKKIVIRIDFLEGKVISDVFLNLFLHMPRRCLDPCDI